MSLLKEYKQQFARTELVHLNNAGLAPICRPAMEKIKYWGERFYREGFYTDHDYMQDVFHTRQNLARLIGCQSDEIAFFQSTAGGVSQIAFAFDLKAGDEVVVWDQEYSSLIYPWQEACSRRGALLKAIPSLPDLSTPYEKLLEACTEKTKVVALSWVQFQTGAMTDVKSLVEACHARGIFVFVDVMQGLGIHEFDFKNWGVDAIAGGSHKWLTSPVGVGFLALRKEHLKKFKPLTIGSGTYGTCDDPADLACTPKTDATRFEAGSKQVLEITALGASCGLILQAGVKHLEEEVLRLSALLRSGLDAAGARIHSPSTQQKSSIVNFTIGSSKDMDFLKENLKKNSINFAMRGPGLRLSPHAFNSDEDIKKVLEVIKLV